MNHLSSSIRRLLPTAMLAICTALSSPNPARAADHGDAPALAHDQGADIADLYLFKDPQDANKVVLVGTFRGFITPGEANNFTTFDENVQFRFEIYNKHVNVTPQAIGAMSA